MWRWDKKKTATEYNTDSVKSPDTVFAINK